MSWPVFGAVAKVYNYLAANLSPARAAKIDGVVPWAEKGWVSNADSNAVAFTPAQLANASPNPAGNVGVAGASFSPDGVHLAIAHNTTPYISIYKRAGDAYSKLPNPAALPSFHGTCAEFSRSGDYLVVGQSTVSPFFRIYKRSGDTFTMLADPATLPAGPVTGAAWSPDDSMLAVAHSGSPFVTIYQRSGDTFTKLANPANLPPNSGHGAAWSPDGAYLVITNLGTSPFRTIYKVSGTTFTRLTTVGTNPASGCYACAFSPNGNLLAISEEASPFIGLYSRSGDTFTRLANPSTLPLVLGYDVEFSGDGRYLLVGHATATSQRAFTVYEISGNTFTFVSAIIYPIVSNLASAGVAVSPDSKHMAIGVNNTVNLFKTTPQDRFVATGSGYLVGLNLAGLDSKVLITVDGTKQVVVDGVEVSAFPIRFEQSLVVGTNATNYDSHKHIVSVVMD